MIKELNAEPQGICDASGFKFPLRELVRQWDGLLVHHRFVDKRNPQDHVTGVRDDQSLPVSRPESADVFLTTNEVQPEDL